MNIKKNITLALIIFCGLIYSCSGDNDLIDVDPVDKDVVYLSMALNSSNQLGTRAEGNYDKDAESRIYSLEVLVFKLTGELDNADGTSGYASIPREKMTVAGKNYDKAWKEIDEIKGVKLTAGKRYVYVVANAPDNYFNGVINLAGFKTKYETLSTQGYGLRAHPSGTVVTDPGGNPIGGIAPDGLHTNLTMCHFGEYTFSNQATQHYLGYTIPSTGIPSGGIGIALDGNKPFEVERLVARVALGRVKFQLPASLFLDGETISKENYSYSLNSIFMINVKRVSPFSIDGNAIDNKFAYGCDTHIYNTYLGSLKQTAIGENEQSTDLIEPMSTRDYDIDIATANSSPLWFYTFENINESKPTYLIIGVSYNFRKANGDLKTAKYYYPVIINESGGTTAGGTDFHKLIKRNFQYRINVIIKGLGSSKLALPGGVEPLLRSSVEPLDESVIEIDEVVGRNLFPWTGNKYK